MGRRSGSDLGPDVAAGIDAYYPVDQLSEALAQSDLLVVCMLTAQTRGLIGAAELSTLRPGGLLINVGRGPLVDPALVAALRSGQLAGAGLDVYWDEPVDPADPILQENVLATAHIGGVTEQAYRATGQRFADNIERLRHNEPLQDRMA